jgi:hypothetical protein
MLGPSFEEVRKLEGFAYESAGRPLESPWARHAPRGVYFFLFFHASAPLSASLQMHERSFRSLGITVSKIFSVFAMFCLITAFTSS